MNQSNDSGLNLDHLDVGYVKRKLAVIVRDLSHYTAQEMARELVRLAKTVDEKEAAKEAGRAALANQPAPTVPVVLKPIPLIEIGSVLANAMQAAVQNGANSISMPDEYVAIAHFIAYPEQYAHQPAQEQAEPFGWAVGFELFKSKAEAQANVRNPDLSPVPLYRAAQQEPVAAPKQAEAPKGGA